MLTQATRLLFKQSSRAASNPEVTGTTTHAWRHNPRTAVAYRGGIWGFNPNHPEIPKFDKAEPNYQFRGIYIRNNLIRIQVSFISNWVEPLSRGLPPSEPRSLCPLSSTEFVERPKNSWRNTPPSSPPEKIPRYASAERWPFTLTAKSHWPH
jgi:hypothetical protein